MSITVTALHSKVTDIIHPWGQVYPEEENCGIKVAGYCGLSDSNCCD